ncbi:MAG TPA: acyl-CoA dehydrogenase family protein [Terrimesophilobacter sp.]|nr:acyl-CoA dehydrogenase family protein [Terrimesophilobacter sp.]
MQPELSTDNQLIVRELTATLTRSCDIHLPDFGQAEQYNRAVFAAANNALSEGGWNELFASKDSDSEHMAMLSRVVEETARATPVLAFPLIETIAARRILTELGNDVASDGVVVANVSRVLTNDSGVESLFPYPALAETFIDLVPSQDAFDVVSYSATQLESTPQDIDVTRPMGRLVPEAKGTKLGLITRDSAQHYAAEALVLTAAELLGTADRLMVATREHLSQREQFGRKLSSHQALRHRLADAFVRIETLRSLVWYAGWVADHSPDGLVEYALIAKGYGAEVAWDVADESIQLFGGMGFTWEQGLHFPASRIATRSLEQPSGLDCLELVGHHSLRRGSLIGLVA